MALFRAVSRLVQCYGPLSDPEGGAELISLTGSTIFPSHPPPPIGLATRFCASLPSYSMVHRATWLIIVSFFNCI